MQDPVLFSGTVKDNLDPFGRCTDAELWKALQLSHMAAVVGADENKLAMHVAESGDNFAEVAREAETEASPSLLSPLPSPLALPPS